MEICYSKDNQDINNLYDILKFHNEKSIIHEEEINYLVHHIKHIETLLNNKLNHINYVTNLIILIIFINLIIFTISQS